MNVVSLNVECPRVDLGPRDAVKARVFDIDNPAAIQANEMMMPLKVGVETGGGAWVAGLGHQAKGNEGPEDAVDRHAGDLREPAANGAVELLRSGVIGAVKDGFEDGAALGGDGEAALAMGSEESVESLFLIARAHDFSKQMRD